MCPERSVAKMFDEKSLVFFAETGLKKAQLGENYPRLGDRIIILNNVITRAVELKKDKAICFMMHKRKCDSEISELFDFDVTIRYPDEEFPLKDWRIFIENWNSYPAKFAHWNFRNVRQIAIHEPYITYQKDAVHPARRVKNFDRILAKMAKKMGVVKTIDLSVETDDIRQAAALIKGARHHLNVNSGFLHVALRSTTPDKITMVLPQTLRKNPALTKWMIPQLSVTNINVRCPWRAGKFLDLL